MNEQRSIFAELKRRNVYKVAVAYAVVAWLLIQIATQVFPFFDIPNWAVRLVVLLLVLGFPVALVLAWAFEITPEGIKRAEDVAPGESIARRTGRKLIGLTVAVAVAAAGLFAWQLLRSKVPATAAPAANPSAPITAAAAAISDKSIAVLPFANLSRDPDNAYFAEGIQDEILTRLSKIADLKVISRTSTLKYQGAPTNLREIGQQLEVANILEGSVQKAGGQVRVTVQLIKAMNDSHLWADTYDRALVDVFQVESDVAQKIAASLEATLTGREKRAIELVGTKNPDAYDAYLRARALQNKQSIEDRERLIQYCRRAVELDPQFAPAWADLAIAESEMYFGDIHTRERFDRARTAAETALRLAPDLPEAHSAIGLFYYYCLQDFDRALQELEFARARLPNNPTTLEEIAIVQRRQGNIDESIKSMEQSSQLDPRNEDLWVNLGRSYRGLRNFPKARDMFDRALSLAPGEKAIIAEKAEVYLAEGDLAGVTDMLRGIDFGAAEHGTGVRIAALFCGRQFDEILRTAASFQADAKNVPPVFLALLHIAIANVHTARGDHALARPVYEEAEREFKELQRSGDESLFLADNLIQVEGHLGRADEVQRQADALIAVTSKDRWRYPQTEEVLARAFTALGDLDRAFPPLEHALAEPGDTAISTAIIRLDPSFDPLRHDPRFTKLLSPK